MKVTAISDLHGNLINIEACDLLLICGDISPLNIQKDYIQMTKWLFNEFYTWIINLPCDNIILTPGNHDFWFEKFINQKEIHLWNKLTILIDEEINIYSDLDDKYFVVYSKWHKNHSSKQGLETIISILYFEAKDIAFII